MSSKEEVKGLLTPKFLIFLAVFIIVHALWSAYNGVFMNWMPWFQGIGLGSDPGPFGAYIVTLFLWLVLALIPSLRKQVSIQQLAILFAVSAIVSNQAAFMKTGAIDMGLHPYWASPELKAWLPSLWDPGEDAYRAIVAGGAPVPWGSWIVPMTYWTLVSVMFFTLGTGWACIMRKRFVEIALFPFPYATVGVEAIKTMAHPKEEMPTTVRNKKLILVAMLLTVLYYSPVLIRKIFPWFPDVYGWENWPYVPWGMASFDPTAAWPALGDIWYGDLMWTMHPWFYGIYYLVPLSISLSVVVGWMVFANIIPHIAVVTGLAPKPALNSHFRGGWISNQYPINTCATWYGMLWTFLAMEFIMNWKYYASTIKAITNPTPEEEKEPVPYRYAWLMVVVSFLVLVGLWAAVGIDIDQAFKSIGILMVFFLGVGIVYAHTSSLWSPGFSSQGISYWVLTPGKMTAAELTRSDVLVLNMTSHRHDDFGLITSSLASPMNTFYVAHKSGIRNKDMLKVILFTVVLANIAAISAYLAIYYSVGHQNAPIRGWFGWGSVDPSGWKANPALDTAWPWAVMGGVIVVIISLLQARIAAFPLNAAGIITGFQQSVVWWGTGAAALVAYIIKTIVLRVGGTEVNEKYGVPIAIGLVLGSAIFIFLYGSLSIYRFYVPA